MLIAWLAIATTIMLVDNQMFDLLVIGIGCGILIAGGLASKERAR